MSDWISNFYYMKIEWQPLKAKSTSPDRKQNLRILELEGNLKNIYANILFFIDGQWI